LAVGPQLLLTRHPLARQDRPRDRCWVRLSSPFKDVGARFTCLLTAVAHPLPLSSGFLGQLILASLTKSHPNLNLIATDIHPPRTPAGLTDAQAKQITSLAADLGEEESIATLFKEKVDLVFALHGIMSGGSESDFELGYRGQSCSHRR
jgi:hypothetical protein